MLSEGAHGLSDLFADRRWPRRPYCTDELAAGLRVRSLTQALRRRYIQANPPMLRVWSIHDIDRPGAAVAWEDADLPPPTWATINRENGHAHLVWGLAAPVLVDGLAARQAPIRYLCAIESMMRARLGADPGFGGLITKNPAHPQWRTLRGPVLGYELRELADYLPGIERHLPRRRPETVGLGRNCDTFDHVRRWAYRTIRAYRTAGGLGSWNAWLAACNDRALAHNAEYPTPMDPRECWWIARSVAKWTWRTLTPAGFRRWQAAQGRKGGLAKGQAYAEARAKARQLYREGHPVGAIAATFGVSGRTVRNWLSEPAVENSHIR